MNNTKKLCLAVALLGVSRVSLQAAPILLTFEGLADQQAIGDYYNGGGGGNFGITFSSNALAVNEFDENEGMVPSPPNGLFFAGGTAATLGDAAGFINGFSFYYSAPFNPGVISVYSGLNDTGTLLATLNLGTTPDGIDLPGCLEHDFCPFVPIGITFDGTARSIDFGGTENEIVFDNITISSSVPVLTSSPELASWMLVGTGMTFFAIWTRRKTRTGSQALFARKQEHRYPTASNFLRDPNRGARPRKLDALTTR